MSIENSAEKVIEKGIEESAENSAMTLVSVPTEGASILVVDDTAANLRLLLNVLSAAGYQVRPVTEGAAAIRAAQLDPPDLILLDIKMPEMDGYEVCRRLKADQRTQDVPVMFLTVLDDVVDIAKGFELGGIDYVTKPVETAELLVRIENQVKLRLLQNQLRESEEKFSLVFRNSPLPLALSDLPESRYVNVNREFIEQSGYSREELIGHTSAELDVWPDIDMRSRLIEDVQKQGSVRELEVRLRTKLGEIRDVLLFLEVIYINAQPYILTTGEDITERKETERQLTAKTEALTRALDTLKSTQAELIRSAKMAALGNLVAGVAHEINTPVGTAIMTASTLENATQQILQDLTTDRLKRSAFEDYLEVAGECSQLILNNLQQAGQLVQSFKQVAVDQTSLQVRTFELKSYLQEVVSNLMPKIKHSPQTIVLTGEEGIMLRSFPGAIAQVLTNLIVNSLTHAYPDDATGQLSIDFERRDEDIMLRYSDDGCGIPSALQHRVFEPFFTTARDRGGSGLGLHLVYNLVTQKLQGKIDIESIPGGGTTFVISLPRSVSSPVG